MSKYDAIIGPTRQTTASSLDEEFRRVTRDNAKDELGAIGNVLGLPAISIPNGFTEENLPTGIQFLGRPYEENRIITLANKYQSLTDWHNRHPESLLEPSWTPAKIAPFWVSGASPWWVSKLADISFHGGHQPKSIREKSSKRK